jgi:ferredoxin
VSDLRKTALGLLKEGRVNVILGYRQGSLPLTSRPYFARDAKAVEQLVWNSACAANLATFLPRLFAKPARPPKDYRPPKVALVAKGCDARSAAQLAKANQFPRENLVIIGMPCLGMIDRDKVSVAVGGAEILEFTESADGKLSVRTASGTKKVDRESVLAEACIECACPTVAVADVSVAGPSRKPAKDRHRRMREFAAKSREERWQLFVAEMSKCIRCNACREACPNCYCKVCFADQTKPAWVRPGDALADKIMFHMGRIYHQAGRCVECDACVRACPMGVDLRLFTQQLVADAEELFGSAPGMTDAAPVLTTFTDDDSEDFMTDPEET